MDKSELASLAWLKSYGSSTSPNEAINILEGKEGVTVCARNSPTHTA
ncbi:MAG TPA: hypothetical protein VFZ67_09515 [Nitrososphaera sp.]